MVQILKETFKIHFSDFLQKIFLPAITCKSYFDKQYFPVIFLICNYMHFDPTKFPKGGKSVSGSGPNCDLEH